MSNRQQKTDTGSLFDSYPGALDMDLAIRWLLTESIRTCNLSREQIAERMSFVTGREISVAMLDAFTAESKKLHRFPLAWINAFCAAVGDYRVLAALIEKSGFVMVTATEAGVARKFLAKEEAERELKNLADRALADRGRA